MAEYRRFPESQTSKVLAAFSADVDLMATGHTIVAASLISSEAPTVTTASNSRFVCTAVTMVWRTCTGGTVATAPRISVGNNYTVFNNIAPVAALSTSPVVDDAVAISLVTPLKRINTTLNAIAVKVHSPAAGPTALTATFFVEGYLEETTNSEETMWYGLHLGGATKFWDQTLSGSTTSYDITGIPDCDEVMVQMYNPCNAALEIEARPEGLTTNQGMTWFYKTHGAGTSAFDQTRFLWMTVGDNNASAYSGSFTLEARTGKLRKFSMDNSTCWDRVNNRTLQTQWGTGQWNAPATPLTFIRLFCVTSVVSGTLVSGARIIAWAINY